MALPWQIYGLYGTIKVARISEDGIKFIKSFEGFRPMAYQDSGGVWTVGYGHTGPDVTQALIITEATAHKLFEADVRKFEQCVENALHRPASQQQFDAMVSFAFNVGCHGFKQSTLLKKFNAGDHDGVIMEFDRWIHDDRGQKMPGLVRRRTAEANLYRAGTPPAAEVADVIREVIEKRHEA